MTDNECREYAAKTSYIYPLRYVSGRIVEYDISSANITMLRKYHKISDVYYNYLQSLPKINREKEIGLLIRSDIKYYEVIKNGIQEAKYELFSKNQINSNSIVRIANDAVYINGSVDLRYTQFGDVLFKIKSISSSMIKLDKLIIFFWYNEAGINIDVKGLSQDKQKLHSNYMISIIAQAIYHVERVSVESAINFIQQFYDDYINLRIDKRYYLELNSYSLYHYKNSDFYLMDIDSINDIDINYNLYILRELWSILLELYNIKIQK